MNLFSPLVFFVNLTCDLYFFMIFLCGINITRITQDFKPYGDIFLLSTQFRWLNLVKTDNKAKSKHWQLL